MKRLASWFMAHPLRPALLCIGLIVLMGAQSCASIPRNDRDWYPYLSHTTHVELEGDSFTINPVSDWTYSAQGPVTQTYDTAENQISALRDVWFMLEPQPGSKLAAHTLLLFEFEGGRLLGLTIEARRESGEDYSAWDGLWNTYELAYIWATARDLLTRRAVMLQHDVFVYPLTLTEEQKRALLTRVLERTAALETTPRFYNTLHSNCTNELAKAADLDWTPSFVFTGRSDNYLFREGIIPGASFEAAEARANLTNFLREWNEGGPEAQTDRDFDAALLAELRRP